MAILIFAPGAVLPRGGDPTLVDASQHSIGQSQHSVNHSVHSVATISSLNSGGKGSIRSGGGGGSGGNGGSGERGGERVTTASRRRRKAATLKRTGQALLSSPTLSLYVLIVLVVAGALGFMDTTLAEHLAAALGASTFTAGLLFTIQITVRWLEGMEWCGRRGRSLCSPIDRIAWDMCVCGGAGKGRPLRRRT